MAKQILTGDRFTASFVPKSIAHNAMRAENLSGSAQPSRLQFDAAVCFVDISGFTAITEQFESVGPDGIENLNSALGQIFGGLIDKITLSGGEIAALPGDAVLAYWPAHEAGVAETVHHAISAVAGSIQMIRGQTLRDGTPVHTHAALTVGPVELLQLGGGDADHRLSLVVGNAVDRAFDLAHAAGADETILDAGATEQLGGLVETVPLDAMTHRFTRLVSPAAPTDLTEPPPEVALDHYIQRGLRERIGVQQDAWLAEFRKLSAVFITIPDVSVADDAGLERANSIVTQVQNIIDRHGGATESVTILNGRAELIALFGLPLRAMEDDARRAVSTASQIRDKLAATGFDCAISVCTGPIFCGLIGTDIWRSYTAHGTVMNRAARVMALGKPGVTIDEPTRLGAGDPVESRPLPPVSLRGVAQPVKLYAVSSDRPDFETAHQDQIFGRDAESATICKAISGLGADSSARVIVVEGSPGIGKSMLLNDGFRFARKQGLRALRGAVDTPVFSEVFAGWRNIYRDLFGLEHDMSTDAALRRVESAMPQTETARRRLPLLTPVLPFAVPNNDLTRQMQGEARAQNAIDLMLGVLEKEVETAPLVIVLDDAERMDTASLRLAQEVSKSSKPILLMIGVRTERDLAHQVVTSLLEAPNSQLIRLSDVDNASIAAIVSDSFGVADVPPVVAEFIQHRAGGNPFFARELAFALQEQGHVAITAGRCDLVSDLDKLTDTSFPDTIERVIISRIDRLEPDVQFTLKIASVLGRQFELREVLGVHPLSPMKETCTQQIEELAQRNLTPLLQAMPERTYFFKHVITHRTVYGLLAFAARRELHQKAAEWIEATIQDPIRTHAAILAHHWLLAERPERALDYLEAAGFEALNSSADREGRELLSQAIEILEVTDTTQEERAAHMYFALAEIEMRLGHVRNSEDKFRAGLGILGLAWPKSKISILTGLLRAAGTQAIHRLRGTGNGGGTQVNSREKLISHGLQKFAYVFFFEDRREEMMLGNLHGLNAAERANDIGAIARASGSLAVVLCVLKQHRWAEYYAQRAESEVVSGADLTDRSYAGNFLGLYATGMGEWERAERAFSRARKAAREVGEKRVELDILSFNRSMHMLLGHHEMLPQLTEEYEIAETAANDVQHGYFLRIGVGELALRMTDLDTAEHWFHDSRDRLLEAYASDHFMALAPLSAVFLLRGNIDEAWRVAAEQIDSIEKSPPVGYYSVEPFWHVNAVLLNMLARNVTPADVSSGDVKQMCRRAVKGIVSQADCFPAVKPRALVLSARFERLQGNDVKAVALAKEAIALALRMQMPLEQAMAEAELGRNLSTSAPARADHTAEAIKIFETIGMSAIAAQTTDQIAPLHG